MFRTSLILLTLLLIFSTSCTKKEPQDPQKVLTDFRNEENLDKKIEIFNEFKETNPEDANVSRLLGSIINSKLKNNEIQNTVEFLSDNEDFANSSIYNNIAWTIFQSKENLKLGEEVAEKGVEAAREELKTLENKPEKYSDEQWKDAKEQQLGFMLDTYGNLQKELGENNEALQSFEEAVNLTKNEMPELNENYVNALLMKEDFQNAKTSIENFISIGKNTPQMKSQLKEVYLKSGGNESEYASYIAEFEEIAKKNMIKKLEDEIIEKLAPQFTLNDLDGKKVNLSDYKGKTVILDFWATWCGPCKQSFPAMKKAVDKFENDKNVKFLFVNTWERVDDKKQNAIDFIQNNKYPFHVLLDDQNEVIAKYEVEGIPTKFVVDKNQNIRFISVGYEGNEDALVEELSYMISLVK